eukprot:TRINITY_DN1245_c0_g4_i1.p1 TRINITY_DN1245_c0_g4~~TRINITY_DN1245_c0_g4_i1.p1  ORF type:complete len:214 (-),score=94.72 TRINITY_DN1245_c0_g4_i1:145-786(-)
MKMRAWAVLGVLSVLCAVGCVHAIQYELDPGVERCIGETIDLNTIFVGGFRISPSYSTQVYVKVLDPTGNLLWMEEDAVEGSFALNTEMFGEYQVCMLSMGKKGVMSSAAIDEKRHVVLELHVGADATDYEKVAAEEDLGPLEVEMRKLEDAMQFLNKEMTYMRAREAAMRDTNESTNTRVLLFSVLSMVTLVVLGLWQVYYLRSYFKKNKVI